MHHRNDVGTSGRCGASGVFLPAAVAFPVDVVGRRVAACDLTWKALYALQCNAMTPTRRNTTMRLDDELYEGMQTVWQRDGINPSEQMRRALRAWLESKGVRFKTERPRAATRKRS